MERQETLRQISLDKLVKELKWTSTFDFILDEEQHNIEKAVKIIESLRDGKETPESYKILATGLNLLSYAGTRFEALNNQEFSIGAIEELFKAQLINFGIEPSGNVYEMANELLLTRKLVTPPNYILESIDGRTRVRAESIETFVEDKAITGRNIDGEFLPVVDNLFNEVMQKLNSDIVLYSGMRTKLKEGQQTTADDFFSYVYVKEQSLNRTDYTSSNKMVGFISEIFRGARKRYFDCGYHTLYSGIAKNEDNREAHKSIGLQSVIRTPITLFGIENGAELRANRIEEFGLRDMDLLKSYATLYRKNTEKAIEGGKVLPMSNV